MRQQVRWIRISIVVFVLAAGLMATGARAPLPPGWDAVTLCYPLVGPVERLSPDLADSTRLRIRAHEDQHAADCRQRGAIPHYLELMRAPGRLRAESRANCAEARQQMALGRDAWLEQERVIDDLRYGYPWFREQPDSVLREAVREACPELAAKADALPGRLTPGQQSCGLRPGAPRLDHVIIAVRDLDALAEQFANLGFRIKSGRPHPNGLLNKHVKFRDGTEIELMTVRGGPGDRMAREYADLIADKDGGAYVALRVQSLDSADAVATRLGLAPRRASAGPWQFLSFDPKSPLGAVFFITGGVPANDADSIFAHADSSTGLKGAIVGAGAQLLPLLGALGAGICPNAPVISAHQMRARAVRLEGGELHILEPGNGFPRPMAANFRSARDHDPRVWRLLPNFVLTWNLQ